MDKNITLYTLSECGRCPIIKMMLDSHNVWYTEIMDNRDLMKNKKIESAPALEVGGEIIDNYHDVLRWLMKNDYYGF
jgi:glutaredoxin